jgi:hypothetical protein
MEYADLGDTLYFYMASNDTSGSGGDGASAAADVREAGGAAGAAPIYSPTPTLLTHASYPDGCYEIAIPATGGNGFSVNNTYAVFCTLAIDAQNPTGFVGKFVVGGAELSSAPTGSSSWIAKLNYLYQYFGFKRVVESTKEEMYQEDDASLLEDRNLSEVANVLTVDRMA